MANYVCMSVSGNISLSFKQYFPENHIKHFDFWKKIRTEDKKWQLLIFFKMFLKILVINTLFS